VLQDTGKFGKRDPLNKDEVDMPHLSEVHQGPSVAYIIYVTSFTPTYGLAVLMLAGPSNILVKTHQSREVKGED
jgi:hypothetical protein